MIKDDFGEFISKDGRVVIINHLRVWLYYKDDRHEEGHLIASGTFEVRGENEIYNFDGLIVMPEAVAEYLEFLGYNIDLIRDNIASVR